MGEKTTLSIAPTGWQSILRKMEVGETHSFYNIDNTAAKGRQAIKRYYQKATKGEVPPRKFETATDKESHTFTITRLE